MDNCLSVLRKLVKACKDIINDTEILGLDDEGYWEDMNEVRKAVAKAEELFKYKEEQQRVRDALVAAGVNLGVDYFDQLTSDDRARFRAAMSAGWNDNSYDSTPVDTLLKEFKEKYRD